MKPPPAALSIAGSDNSAGAGIQADLKTFSANGVYGLTAVTCIVAEVPGCVTSIQPVKPRLVRDQIRLCFEAFPVSAVKTGMLFSPEIIETVLSALASHHVPLVVDPVMVASSGDPLLQPAAVRLYVERLIPRATLVTPNLDEATALLNRPIQSVDAMRAAGTALVQQFGTAFLLKGGHLRSDTATDLLFDGDAIHEFTAPFRPGISTHGTGCTFSAAITAHLASGKSLPEAVAAGKQFVASAIENYFRWTNVPGGSSTDALNLLPGNNG